MLKSIFFLYFPLMIYSHSRLFGQILSEWTSLKTAQSAASSHKSALGICSWDFLSVDFAMTYSLYLQSFESSLWLVSGPSSRPFHAPPGECLRIINKSILSRFSLSLLCCVSVSVFLSLSLSVALSLFNPWTSDSIMRGWP